MTRPLTIEKVLSANDTGATGTHQAGMLIPKTGGVLEFFPLLASGVKNPRETMQMRDDDGTAWGFTFIYYNNKAFGGTRNEFRLTGMTAYLRTNSLRSGDSVLMMRDAGNNVRITFRRTHTPSSVLRLSGTWKVIEGKF